MPSPFSSSSSSKVGTTSELETATWPTIHSKHEEAEKTSKMNDVQKNDELISPTMAILLVSMLAVSVSPMIGIAQMVRATAHR